MSPHLQLLLNSQHQGLARSRVLGNSSSARRRHCGHRLAAAQHVAHKALVEQQLQHTLLAQPRCCAICRGRAVAVAGCSGGAAPAGQQLLQQRERCTVHLPQQQLQRLRGDEVLASTPHLLHIGLTL
jgi:hypothetical protein